MCFARLEVHNKLIRYKNIWTCAGTTLLFGPSIICTVINCKYLLFAGNLKSYSVISGIIHYLLLQNNISHVFNWCDDKEVILLHSFECQVLFFLFTWKICPLFLVSHFLTCLILCDIFLLKCPFFSVFLGRPLFLFPVILACHTFLT